MSTNGSKNSWPVRADSTAVRITCWLLDKLKNLLLGILGLLTIFVILASIFEYGEGTADISRLELIFLAACFALLQRHIFYCRKFATGFWKGLVRLLTAFGFIGLVLLCIYGVYFFSLVHESENLAQEFQLLLHEDDPIGELIELGLVLLVIYLAAPFSHASKETGVREVHLHPATEKPATAKKI